MAKDPRIQKLGVAGYNKPRQTRLGVRALKLDTHRILPRVKHLRLTGRQRKSGNAKGFIC